MNIQQIVIDPEVQVRDSMSEETIEEYALALKQGAIFPPVIIFHVANKFILADGFHRIEAFKRAKVEDVRVEIKEGTKRDAILYSISANATHGVRRTRADIRKAVEILLRDEEWRKWSNNEIAKRCGCTHQHVFNLRKNIYPNEIGKAATRLCLRRGQVVTMSVGKISKATMAKDPLDTIPKAPEEAAADKESNNLFQLKRIWMRASALNRKQFLKWIATQKK